MRIHEVEIYTAKQIRAFIQYLNVLADEKEFFEKQQLQWQGNAIGSGLGVNQASATPEYMAKLRAQAIAEAKAQESQEEVLCGKQQA